MMAAEMEQVPFDMSKETLKSIREWIDKITQLSLGMFGGTRIPMNEVIIIKKDMIRQLIVLASPMIENDLEEIEEFFDSIVMAKGNIKTSEGWARGVVIYDYKIDTKLDECVKGIQRALKKYFVPAFREGEKY